jgi:hypothetical protein
MAAFATEPLNGTPRQPLFAEAGESRLSGFHKAPSCETPMVFNAASKSTEFADRMRSHYRETRRLPVEIPCSIEIVQMDGEIYDCGVAVVRNISPSGALISSFSLERGNFPASLFKIRMILKGDPYAGIGIEATPIRFAAGMHGIGVKFDEIFVAV